MNKSNLSRFAHLAKVVLLLKFFDAHAYPTLVGNARLSPLTACSRFFGHGCEADEKKLFSCRLQAGDIVFARTGATTGKSFLIRECPPNAVFASYLIRVRPSEKVDPNYLAQFFDSSAYWNQIALKAAGAAQPGVNSSKLKELKIPLPPLEEQRRIAGILDQADALRRLRTRALDKLNTLGQAIFHEMFGDPAIEPDKWPTIPLSEFSVKPDDIKCGPFGTQLLKSEFVEDGVPLWGIKQVNRHFRIQTHEYVTAEKSIELSGYSIRPGDIVMTRKGTIGNCAVYPAQFPNGIMHSDLLRLRVNRERHLPEFVADQLRFNRSFSQQLELISGGAIMAGINVSRLKALHAISPP